jgi:pyruvate,water dikinase
MAATADPTIIPVDDYVSEELYPGYKPAFGGDPFVAEPLRPFSKADNKRFWFHDSLHFGLGMVPGSIGLVDDAQSWGAQLGAEIVGVPPTRGSVDRLLGTHIYLGIIDVESEWQIQARAGRFGRYVGPMLQNFPQVWGGYVEELTSAYQHFDNLPLASMDRAQLWVALQDAYAFHKRGWFIHFEVMYALSSNFLAFYGLAQELGLESSHVARFMSGERTAYTETDEQLWRLADRARELSVTDALQSGESEPTRQALERLPNGSAWWTDFEQFLQKYGWRTEETCTINTASWAEDPSPALATLRSFVNSPERHDFAVAQTAAIAERDNLIEQARRKIGGGANLQRFNEALAANHAANFAWWNDEHNFLIDRRIQIPVHRVSLELGKRLVDDGQLDQPDDIFFVFRPELFSAMEDDNRAAAWGRLKAMIPDRRVYYREWLPKGPELPPVLGTIPDVVVDPIMVEVFGLTGQYLRTIKEGGAGEEIKGFPAASGTAEGIARVVNSASDLHLVQPGEVLVCGGTTTEWTPVFGIIRACVCDGGGSLTHASIVSREYGIPCVVGTAVATRTIKTGDRVRVDGTNGTVTIRR